MEKGSKDKDRIIEDLPIIIQYILIAGKAILIKFSPESGS